MKGARVHPLVTRVRRALGREASAHGAYLSLLARRLGALHAVAGGRAAPAGALGRGRADRALARRFLRPREASWDDGDENLVRGWLDRWERAGEGAAGAARALMEAADALGAIESRPEVLWFFLWELESMLDVFGARIPAPFESRDPGRS